MRKILLLLPSIALMSWVLSVACIGHENSQFSKPYSGNFVIPGGEQASLENTEEELIDTMMSVSIPSAETIIYHF